MAVNDRFISPPHIRYEGVVERYEYAHFPLNDAFDKLNAAKEHLDRFFAAHTDPCPDNDALNAEYNRLRAVYSALSIRYAAASANVRTTESALHESLNNIRDAIDEMCRSSEVRSDSIKSTEPDKPRITYL